VGCEGAIIHRDLENREGMGPKNRRILVIFGLRSGYAAVAALKRRGGPQAWRLSGWCGYDWRDSLCLGKVAV
jgi:hypothetical protein